MAINKVLLIDVETTGLDLFICECIEVACIIYSVSECAPISSFSSLMYATNNAAEHINEIPVSLLLEAPPADIVWGRVIQMAQQCDALVAHRAEFDRAFSPPELQSRKWICSKFDITDWPKTDKIGESLVPLCLAHGVGVVAAHRALTDCDLMARLFARVAELGVDVSAMLERAMRPKKTFVADVSFNDKDLAKNLGFAWNPDDRIWWRAMPPDDVHKMLWPFKIRQID